MYEVSGLGGGGTMYCPAVMPGDTSVMFVNCDMGGLYRSADGGRSWRMADGHVITAGTRCQVAFHPDDLTPYLFAPYRGIVTSADKGVTWTTPVTSPLLDQQLFTQANGANAITAIAVDPANPPGPGSAGRIYVGTNNGVFVTTNTGASWTKCTIVIGDVVGFVILRDPGSAAYLYYCATSEGVYSLMGTAGTDVSAGLPAKPALQFRVRSIAGGADGMKLSLYVTVPSTVVNNVWVSGGVYSAVKQVAGALGAFAEAMGAGGAQPLSKLTGGVICAVAEYDFVGVARGTPDTVYVTHCGTAEPPTAGSYSGVYKSTMGGGTWSQVYNGYNGYTNAAANVQGGWHDFDLRWGFGGPARFPDPQRGGGSGGFTVCATDPNLAVFTNLAGLYVTSTGGAADPTLVNCGNPSCAWRQGYTGATQAPPAAGQRWRSVGLEVTTTWRYEIDPHDSRVHYICYTDVGFARSTDRGSTWAWSAPRDRRAPAQPRRYGNVYELAFDDAAPGRVWAGVSDQHDIPYEAWLVVRSGGGVSRSDDYGQTWVDYSASLPATTSAFTGQPFPDSPAGPVTSVALDQGTRRLWAAVFGSGVYSSDNASTVVPNSAVIWDDRSYNLPQSNRNVYRLQLDANGSPYCLVTAKRNVAGSAQTTFTHETGLWHLEQPGGNWQWRRLAPSAGGQPDLWYITDFVVHPNDANVIFITTASLGGGQSGTGTGVGVPGGLYRTLDGGQTWQLVLCLKTAAPTQPCEVLPYQWRDFVQAFKVTLDEDAPDTVYAGTRTHGLWVSRDRGTTWAEYLAPPALPFMSIHRVRSVWEFWLGRWWPCWPYRWWCWEWWPWRWWPFRCFSERRVQYVTTFGGGVFKVAYRRWRWPCWPWWLTYILRWPPFRWLPWPKDFPPIGPRMPTAPVPPVGPRGARSR